MVTVFSGIEGSGKSTHINKYFKMRRHWTYDNYTKPAFMSQLTRDLHDNIDVAYDRGVLDNVLYDTIFARRDYKEVSTDFFDWIDFTKNNSVNQIIYDINLSGIPEKHRRHYSTNEFKKLKRAWADLKQAWLVTLKGLHTCDNCFHVFYQKWFGVLKSNTNFKNRGQK